MVWRMSLGLIKQEMTLFAMFASQIKPYRVKAHRATNVDYHVCIVLRCQADDEQSPRKEQHDHIMIYRVLSYSMSDRNDAKT